MGFWAKCWVTDGWVNRWSGYTVMTTRAPTLQITIDRIRNFIECNFFVWQVTSLVNPYAWASQCALSSLVCLGQLFAPYSWFTKWQCGIFVRILSFFNQNIRGKHMNFFLWLICVVFIYICSCIPFFVILIQICPFLQYLCLYLCICTNFCIFHLFPPPSQYLCIGPHPFHTLLPPTPH